MSAARDTPLRELVIYGRPGCHLCDEARDLLAPLAEELSLDLRVVDIESDEQLLRRYLEAIPVICARSRELGRLDDFRADGFTDRVRDFVRIGY